MDTLIHFLRSLIAPLLSCLTPQGRTDSPSPPPSPHQSELETLLSTYSSTSEAIHPPKPRHKALTAVWDAKSKLLIDEEEEERESRGLGLDFVNVDTTGKLDVEESSRKWDPEMSMDDMRREEELQAERERVEAANLDEGFGRFESAIA
jgi:hypothetical protein